MVDRLGLEPRTNVVDNAKIMGLAKELHGQTARRNVISAVLIWLITKPLTPRSQAAVFVEWEMGYRLFRVSETLLLYCQPSLG